MGEWEIWTKAAGWKMRDYKLQDQNARMEN